MDAPFSRRPSLKLSQIFKICYIIIISYIFSHRSHCSPIIDIRFRMKLLRSKKSKKISNLSDLSSFYHFLLFEVDVTTFLFCVWKISLSPVVRQDFLIFEHMWNPLGRLLKSLFICWPKRVPCLFQGQMSWMFCTKLSSTGISKSK